ncbi:MAG: L-threonylcarbamoyladenylate synthase [Candidatus Aenigmarchaeota archaeon]|nr:L-threonylcarbamoyladenylate synthase [Candidatus Aenigmarchaeota archaeon]
MNIEMGDLKRAGVRRKLKGMILDGLIFAYPTDTVYGIGCNALIGKSVERIRKLKGSRQPFSVIAPSKEWIERHVIIKKRHRRYLDLLPGPYTIILEKKNKRFLKKASPLDTLGIRIPRHPFSMLVSEAGVPFITTSANRHGKRAASEIKGDKIPKADIIINGGRLSGKPSIIIDLTSRRAKILRR